MMELVQESVEMRNTLVITYAQCDRFGDSIRLLYKMKPWTFGLCCSLLKQIKFLMGSNETLRKDLLNSVSLGQIDRPLRAEEEVKFQQILSAVEAIKT
jgi:hypothetical protein